MRFLLALSLVALPLTAVAQTKPADGGTATAPAAAPTGQAEGQPKRIRSVTLTSPTDKCPASTGEEIVVCNTLDNPYRIPKELRGSGPIPTNRQAWTNRVAADEQSSREAAGLPDTCSPVGTGGQTGCARATARAFKADKRAKATNEDPNATTGE